MVVLEGAFFGWFPGDVGGGFLVADAGVGGPGGPDAGLVQAAGVPGQVDGEAATGA